MHVALAWLLSSVLDGWASEAMLEAYEAERLPITDQVSRLAMDLVLENAAALGASAPPPELSDPGPAGQELRDVIGPILRDLNVPQFAPEGLNFGYFYERVAHHRPRRRRAAALHDGRDHAVDGAGLSHAPLRGRTVGRSWTCSAPTTRSSASTPTSTSRRVRARRPRRPAGRWGDRRRPPDRHRRVPPPAAARAASISTSPGGATTWGPSTELLDHLPGRATP